MYPINPRTGKEIKIIETSASVWRENKTLFYSQDKCVWDTVHEGDNPTYRIILDGSTDINAASKNSKLLLIAKAVLDSAGNLSVNNVICLEEVHLMYPHLGNAWDGTVADAAVIMAGLLRYRRLAGTWNQRAVALNLVRE